MEIEKRSDLTAKKVLLKEEELKPILEKYIKRIELMARKGSFKKLMIPLGKNNMQILEKMVKEKLGLEIEYIPVTSAENLFAVSLKRSAKS